MPVESPRESKMNRRRGVAVGDCKVKLSTPGCRTEIRVDPTVVGSSCVALQLGLEKMIHPACQSSPEVAQVGVPPVKAFAVLADMSIKPAVNPGRSNCPGFFFSRAALSFSDR